MLSEFVFYVISHDIWFYLSHILLHKIRLLKEIHRIHHTKYYRKLIFSDTYVCHYIEAPFQGAGILFPLLFIKLRLAVFMYVLLYLNIRSMMKHDNRFIWLIGNHHILHHKYPQYNYGEYWLDRIFGTNYNNSNECVFGLIQL